MAPKKKSKGSKGAKGTSSIIDGIPISEMSREQLEAFVSRIQLELEREREERNYFQLERDKLKSFWEVTRQQLEENRGELKNKNKELEDADEEHQKEIKVCQQKVKHMIYEQQEELTQLKIKNMISMKTGEMDFMDRELFLLNEKREETEQKMENEKIHAEQIRVQIMDCNEKISKIRSDYENECRILERRHQQCMDKFREEMEFKNEIEVDEIEQRKNNFIKIIMEQHDQIYNGIINFYTEITAKNLALLGVLKERLLKMRNEKYRMEHDMQFLKNQNKTLLEPLEIARVKITEMQNKIQNLERDQKQIRIVEKQYNQLRKKFDSLQYSYDILCEEYETLKEEKEENQKSMMTNFLNFQKDITYEHTLLEQKLVQLNKIIEEKEAQIIDIILGENNYNKEFINKKFSQDNVGEKNEIVASLTKEISCLMDTHSQIVKNYEKIYKS